MKEKEKLLSFDTPLKFIFSHSALKEGWDNPNVFQICTLRDIRPSASAARPSAGALRLCVNQNGERVRGFEVNTLTVIATENYEQFAENLQKEIEADTGIRFGIVEQHQFAAIAVTGADGQGVPLGVDQSKALWDHLKAAGHIDAKGKVQDSLKTALKDGNPGAAGAFERSAVRSPRCCARCRAVWRSRTPTSASRLPCARASASHARVQGAVGSHQAQDDLPRAVRQRQADPELHRFADKAPPSPKARLQWRKADIAIGKAGVEARRKRAPTTSSWTRRTSSCRTC
jgi:type III restriction enzyme